MRKTLVDNKKMALSAGTRGLAESKSTPTFSHYSLVLTRKDRAKMNFMAGCTPEELDRLLVTDRD